MEPGPVEKGIQREAQRKESVKGLENLTFWFLAGTYSDIASYNYSKVKQCELTSSLKCCYIILELELAESARLALRKILS